jgi:2-hydroxy-6-oxonona-2,4-dienedioate hydrolase
VASRVPIPAFLASDGYEQLAYRMGGMSGSKLTAVANKKVYTSFWLKTNGLQVHTRRSLELRPAVRSVVLVHGLGVSADYMLPTLVRLAPDFNVWAPELPGFGKSDKPAHVLDIHELADTLAAWVRVIEIPSAVFLGNSLGCQVIIDLAVRYPSVVEATVLIGPTVDIKGHTMIQQLWRGLRDLVHEPWSLWRILARDYLLTGTVRMWQTFQFALQDDVLSKCPRVMAPTLIVRGTKDTISPARWVERLASLMPNSCAAEIPEGTHASNYSTPDELAGLVRNFVNRQPNTS